MASVISCNGTVYAKLWSNWQSHGSLSLCGGSMILGVLSEVSGMKYPCCSFPDTGTTSQGKESMGEV